MLLRCKWCTFTPLHYLAYFWFFNSTSQCCQCSGSMVWDSSYNPYSFILNHCRSLTFILIIMCMIMRTLAPHVTCVSPRFILYLTQCYKLCMLYYKFCWHLWHEDILSGFDQKLPALCSRCCTKQSRTVHDQTDVLLNVFMCSADWYWLIWVRPLPLQHN